MNYHQLLWTIECLMSNFENDKEYDLLRSVIIESLNKVNIRIALKIELNSISGFDQISISFSC